MSAKPLSFNEITEVARKASLRLENWFKTIVVVKTGITADGPGYTYYPLIGSAPSTVQATYRLGRRIK